MWLAWWPAFTGRFVMALRRQQKTAREPYWLKDGKIRGTTLIEALRFHSAAAAEQHSARARPDHGGLYRPALLAYATSGATQVGLRRVPCGRAFTTPGSLDIRRCDAHHRQRCCVFCCWGNCTRPDCTCQPSQGQLGPCGVVAGHSTVGGRFGIYSSKLPEIELEKVEHMFYYCDVLASVTFP